MRPECEDCKHLKWRPTEDPSMGKTECEYDEPPTVDIRNNWCDGWEWRYAQED